MKTQLRGTIIPKHKTVYVVKKRHHVIFITKELFSLTACLFTSITFLTLAFLGPQRSSTPSFLVASPTYASETPTASLSAYLPFLNETNDVPAEDGGETPHQMEETSPLPPIENPVSEVANLLFISPLSSHSGISTQFSSWHPGIDFVSPLGTPVLAVADGVVTTAGWMNNGYGQLITIVHANGISSLYAHLSTMLVSTGQSVKQGDVIGHVGCSGNCTGSHLHFSLSQHGQAFNPL